MKKNHFVLLWMVIISFAVNAQTAPVNTKTDDERVQVFIGIYSGLDYNINAYKLTKNENYGYSYYGMSPRYNIGVGFGLKIKRFRPRIEMKFVNLKYGIDWSTSVYNFGKTIANVNYFDFNFHLDYALYEIKKFQLFVSPGLNYEYETGNSISTSYWNILELEHPSRVAGGGLSAIVKYNLSEHFGFTLIPEYAVFFPSFAKGNSKPYQRFSGNFGFEFKF